MYVEIARLTKALATQVARVWLVTRVNALVCREVAALTKCFMTHTTRVRFVTCVNPDVFN